MSKRSFICLFLLAGLLTACATVTPTPIPTLSPPLQKISTIENAGKICFRDYSLSTHELSGTFRPKGCFSSSCTVPQEQQVDVQFDHDQAALKFVTKFVLLDTSVSTPSQVCTADCSGGGEVPFKFTDVVTGTYPVMLGNQKMGSLDVPPVSKQSAGVCFGELP